MKGTRLRTLLLATGASILMTACVVGGTPPEPISIPVTALTSGTHAAVVAVIVNGSDSSPPRRVQLRVHDGIAEGAIPIDPGLKQLVSARAYDADGLVTHAGNILMEVLAEEESYASVRMSPRFGEPPLALWLGTQVHHAGSRRAQAGTD